MSEVIRVGPNFAAAEAAPASSNVQVTVHGGVTRAQFGGHAHIDLPDVQPTTERSDAGSVTKYVEGQGITQQSTIVRANTAEIGRLTGGNGASILSTAKNNGGEPTGNLSQNGVTVCLIPGDERTRT